MDAHTLELLEFDKIRKLIAGYAQSSLGRDLAHQLEPGTDPRAIQAALTRTQEMTQALQAGMVPPLGGLKDVRLLVRRAAIGSMLNAEELLEVRQVLLCTGRVYRYRMQLDPHWAALIELLQPVQDLGPVAKSIDTALDERGHILDGASPELQAVRKSLRELDEKAQHLIRRLLNDTEMRKILRFPQATFCGDHYVFPVAVQYRHRMPGVVHRTSPTGETVYIEPTSLAALSAERAVMKAEEHKEEQRVLRRLTAEVARVATPLLAALDVLAELDLLQAKARYALEYDMQFPDLSEEGKLYLRQARHPLLEYLYRHPLAYAETVRVPLENEPPTAQQSATSDQAGTLQAERPRASAPASAGRPSVVPIDVRVGWEFRMLVITGPNTGGKTVALKTTGLLCLMAHAGLPIPAHEGSLVPLLDNVLADIGDEQSIEQSLSTFSSHMTRIAQILETATARSLVLLDELGAGTDPVEGAALGRAILDELDRLGCLALITTHLGDLKTYAFANPRAENAAVEFDSVTLRPTYRLLIGQFGTSNALKIAKSLRLPRSLLARAYRYLRQRRRGKEWMHLQRLREQTERARAEAVRARLEAQREKELYERQRAALLEQEQERQRLEEARRRLQPGDRIRIPRLEQTGEVVRIDWKKNLAIVRAGVGQWELPITDIYPLDVANP
ncbi:MAG: DNA strand exchange inhibitor protein [Gemmataceae bacterium]